MIDVQIEIVGEKHGDCFFIEVKNDVCRNIIMVDGQKGDKESLEAIKEKILFYEKIDYLVVTHIDNDHINGILKIFELPETDNIRRAFKDTVIFYNYVTKPVISYAQARAFEQLIQKNVVLSTICKDYRKYSSPCLKILSAEQRKYFDPRRQGKLDDYLVMTLLHPDRYGIEKVHLDYLKGRKKPAAELINKNSIAFLLEQGYPGWAALFTGDCYLDDLMDEIKQLKNMQEGEKYRSIDILKIPHHGAKEYNQGLAEFCDRHAVHKFILTGPSKWDGSHPSRDILKKVDATSYDGCFKLLFTNIDIPFLDELEYIKKIENDTVKMWGC